MRRKQLVRQIDPKWCDIPRHYDKAVIQLEQLDELIHECLNKPSKRALLAAKRALYGFTEGICDLIDHGITRTQRYSVYNYGCLDCCFCMVALDFNARFYFHDQKRPLEPTPENLIKSLRSWQLLSLIGYSYDSFADQMAILTRGKVQLVLHRDFGERGAKTHLLQSQLLELCRNDAVSVVACVKGHSAFGDKQHSHWIVLDAARAGRRWQLQMRDPSRKTKQPLTYRTIYELCIYAVPADQHQIVFLKL